MQASSRLATQLDWPGIAQVCRIDRSVKKNGVVSSEVSYAITSLSPDRASATELLALNRLHWGIENRLHWVRDVTFGEDSCRAKAGHSPQNLAALRNVSISLLRLSNRNGIAATLRDFATKPLDLLKFLSILKQ